MRQASLAGYSRNISKKDRSILLSIYKDETGKDFASNLNCTNCLVSILSELKKMYDNHTPEEKERSTKNERREKRKTSQVPEPGTDATGD